MRSPIVYLDNLPTEANLNDIFTIFGKYGPIERVKFPKQYADDEDEEGYSTGIALVKFKRQETAIKCVNDKNPIIIDGHVIHVYNSPDAIKNRVLTSVFVFFSSVGETREHIAQRLSMFSPISCQIYHPAQYNRYGMAVVQFRSNKDKDMAIEREKQNEKEGFMVKRPLYDFETLEFEDNDLLPKLVVTPPSHAYESTSEFDRWYDFEIKHQDSTYRVNSFVASSLSKKIRDQLMGPPSPTKFSLQSSVTVNGPYNLIISSLMGHEIHINAENVIFLLLCAKDLEMDQLADACWQLVNDMSDSELVFHFACDLCMYKLDYSKQVQYIVDNFDKLQNDPSFKLLPLDVVISVLEKIPEKTRDSLPFADWLLSYIGQNSEARVRLISFIPFGKIDSASVRNILSRVGVNMNSLKDAIIRNIVIGSGPEAPSGPTNVIKCPYEHGNLLRGIFSIIKDIKGLPASEVIKVTGTSDLHMILDPTWTKSWVSPSIPDMWVCFDLDASQKMRFLSVKSYTIRTALQNEPCHLRSWKLEGSNDMKTWWLLHNQPKCSVLKGNGKTSTFNTNMPVKGQPIAFRYVKLTQTDKNWADTYALCIQAIEFHGEVYMGEKREKKGVFRYEKGKEWSGYFDYLTRLSIGNPVHSKEVAITSAASPSKLVDLEWPNGYWRSPDSPNSYVLFSFPGMSVSIETYVIKSYSGAGNCYPTTWEIEGSDDNVQWTIIDKKTKVKTLCGPGKIGIFTCDPSKKYKYIRIKQNGENNAGQHSFVLSHVEFFGSIYLYDKEK